MRRGGSQPEDPPPPSDPPLREREPRSGASAPPPAFLPPTQDGTAVAPTSHPTAADRVPAKGVTTTTAPPLPLEAEPSPERGKVAQGGSQLAASQRGGGGGSQPSTNRRPTAAGKQPVQAGSPGLSTDRKPKRGWGVAGANTAGRVPAQGRHRPRAARALFALGFTRAATMTSPRDEGQGRASAPPRGSETPGKGRGRVDSEDT